MDSYYDTIAEGYDTLHREEQVEKVAHVMNILAEHKIPLHGIILDVGAGTGISSEALAQEGCRCVLLEPSRKMLQQCQRENVIKVIGSAEKIPFPDTFFDGIISLTAIHHCDLQQAVGEIERVVKKRGWIAISLLKAANKEKREVFRTYTQQDIGKDILFFKRT